MARKAIQPSLADLDAAPGGAAAVDRTLSILKAFTSQKPALTLAEIAEQTMLYKSTVLRLLASLEHGKMIQKNDDNRYVLGAEVARLYGAYSASFALESVVLPVMKKLVSMTGESASFHVRQGNQRLCLYRVDCHQPIRDHIRAGDLFPLDRGVGGRVLLAFDGEPGELYDQIRKTKVMSSVGDRSEGISGISSPVFDTKGKLVGSLILTMPDIRFKKTYETVVREMALEITEGLGGSKHLFD